MEKSFREGRFKKGMLLNVLGWMKNGITRIYGYAESIRGKL